MRSDQFKAWLEGFEEAIESSPTKKQWAKIKAKLATVHETHYYNHPYVWPMWSDTNMPCTSVYAQSTGLSNGTTLTATPQGLSSGAIDYIEMGRTEALS